jgi:hypothetical protein
MSITDTLLNVIVPVGVKGGQALIAIFGKSPNAAPSAATPVPETDNSNVNPHSETVVDQAYAAVNSVYTTLKAFDSTT